MKAIFRSPSAPFARGSSIANRIFSRHLITMATARTIHITPENTGLGLRKQTEAAAKKVTELLQQDLEKHHCYFNDQGFHNHISHHLLALYGIGAPPDAIQKGYDDNTNYQRSPYEVHKDQIKELKDFDKAKKKLGKEEYYTDFLIFYQNEIDEKGWQAVLSEYLFKGDERSEDMLVRMFASFMHPIIQLMYGIEWEQPAIVAMGLAQASVHEADMAPFLLGAEEAARSSTQRMPEIASLYQEVKADEKLFTAAQESKTSGVRAFDEIIRVARRVSVQPEELDERTIEMYDNSIYHAASAALRPGKEPRFDFFLMHHINVGPLFLAINKRDWIPTASKVRLLEWKIRIDLLHHAARGAAPASLEKIASYVPKDNTRKPTTDLLARVFALYDDGHASKLVRAIEVCQNASKAYEGKAWPHIKGDDLWTTLYHLVVDSVEGDEPKWIRSAEEWTEVPDRPENGQGHL